MSIENAYDDITNDKDERSSNDSLHGWLNDLHLPSHSTELDSMDDDDENLQFIDEGLNEDYPMGIDLENYSDAPKDNGRPYYVRVNRKQNVVTVYELDEEGYYTVPVRAMVCSVGKNNATPMGTFTTSDKHEWSALIGGVYGQYAYRIDGHIMFHSVPYYKMDKSRLESEEYNKLGSPASLGCVRLAVKDAKWIYDNCPAGTLVTIYDSDYPGPMGKPCPEMIDLEDERAGWDPTDPDDDNPWNEGDIRIFGTRERVIERGYSYHILSGISAYDEKGNDISSYIVPSGRINSCRVGSYDVGYNVIMPDGQTKTVSSTIRVVDTIAPEIVLEESNMKLNRIEASEANLSKAIFGKLHVIDGRDSLSEEYIHIKTDDEFTNIIANRRWATSETDQELVKGQLSVYATDAQGNQSESVKLSIEIDCKPPHIDNPSSQTIEVESEEEIYDAFCDIITVTDYGSGVDSVAISWTKHISYDDYSIMVIAEDNYGNISTEFFDNINIIIK